MGLIRDISIGMSVNTRGFTAGLKSADAQLALFGKTASRVGSVVGTLSPGLAALGTAAGAVNALKGAVSTATSLEKTLAGLSKATDLEGDALGSMKRQLFSLSTELKGVKLEDILSIATTGAKLGVASSDLVEYTRGIAMLSTAMDDIPAEQVADQVGKINVVFKLGVEGALKLGSTIDKLADSGAASAVDILDVTQRIGGLAASMGLGAGETAALATALLDTGTKAEAAGGAISKLLAKMVDTKNHANFAKTAGLSVEKFSELVETRPIEAVQKYLEALKKLDAGQQTASLASVKIKGTEQITEIIKLVQQTENLQKYIGLAAHEFRTLDQITKSYAATARTTDAAWDQFHNRMEVISDLVGGTFLPAINLALAGIGEGLDRVNAGALTVIDTLGTIKAAAESFGITIDTSALGQAAGQGAAGAFGGITGALGLPFTALAAMGGGGTPAAAPGPAGGKAANKAALTAAKAAEEAKAAKAEDEAAHGSEKLEKAVEKLNARLHDEIATMGMSARAAEIYKLKQDGASAADIKALEALDAKKTALEAAAKAKEGVAELTSKLREQVDTFGMGAEAAEIYRLKVAGASDEELAGLKALAEKHTALEEAKQVYEDTRTPLEKYQESTQRLDELLASGAIDQETHSRATRAARDEVTGGGEQKPMHAAALELGSKEAYSAQLRFTGQRRDEEPNKEVAKNTGEVVQLTRLSLTALNKIADQATNPGFELLTF